MTLATNPATGAGESLAASAAAEWSALVTAAVLGTDRHPLAPAEPGWDTWSSSSDPAVALLDRAGAVVVARRAGACPSLAPDAPLPVAPIDERRQCPVACGDRLRRMLAGEHAVLLPEWFALVERHDLQLPWELLPSLLLRGRRDSELDLIVRRLARGRAAWLAEVVPELGVRPQPRPPSGAAAAAAGKQPPRSRLGPTESQAAVAGLLGVFQSGRVNWAMTAQLRTIVIGLDPSVLASLLASLSALPSSPAADRTRWDLVALTEFRNELHRDFQSLPQPNPGHLP